jgi:hypothetical protein
MTIKRPCHPVAASFLVAFLATGLPTVSEAGTSCPGLQVPTYFYPTVASPWERLRSSSPARRRISTVTINHDSGRGTSADANYVRIAAAMKAAGYKVLAYVYTQRGNKPVETVKSQIDNQKAWYAVDGIFVDEVAHSSDKISYYSEIVFHIRASVGGFVTLNPGSFYGEDGSALDERYARMADTIVVFEGTYRQYMGAWKRPSWSAQHPASKFTHLIHTTANSVAAMNRVLDLAQLRNAGHLHVTDDGGKNPWDRLPQFWDALISDLRVRCSL